MREWRNAAGWKVQLYPVTGVLYIITPSGKTIGKQYDYWERQEAPLDARELAEGMGMEECFVEQLA